MGNLQEDWNPEVFKHEIMQIVSRISRIDEADLQDDLLIREEVGIDSLMAMEIIATCEKYLGIKIDETLFVEIQTVRDFLLLLMKLRREKNV